MKVISGSSNPQLAATIAQQLNLELIPVELTQFANGETRVWIQGQDDGKTKIRVRGENIAIVQSFSTPVDQHIMEFLMLADALERLGARHVNVIIPWMGYSLQDKVFREGESIAAKVVANLVSSAHIKRAFLLDLHNTSTPGFFSIPTEHLSALDVFVQYSQDHFNLDQTIVASPDFGGLKRARVFANHLGVDLCNIDKHRDLKTGDVTAVDVHGDVSNKVVLLFDDCIVSGGTVIETAQLLKERGAKEVHFFATHGLFVNNALERLQPSQVDSIVVTNSIHQPVMIDKLKMVDVSHLFAQSLSDWI